ncbi:hypothetical protein CIT31_03725 [Mesorhizobium wenxiniae]|uniref:Uncharacterized protein n=2 Tax=Mesorhizobium wenxiniae TaxID=2014805 RepID=A0A271KM40_9HYPH|nr:hypothetical protein CIT31_03725 [Mesorhizobium wenxiniae]
MHDEAGACLKAPPTRAGMPSYPSGDCPPTSEIIITDMAVFPLKAAFVRRCTAQPAELHVDLDEANDMISAIC